MHPAAPVNDVPTASTTAVAAPCRKRRAADSDVPCGGDGGVGLMPCPSSGCSLHPPAAAIVPLSPPVEPGPKRRTPFEGGSVDALPDVKRRNPLEPPSLGGTPAADKEAAQQRLNGDCATAQCADENAPPHAPPSLPHLQPGSHAAVMAGSRPPVATEVGAPAAHQSNCSSGDAQKPAAAISAPESPDDALMKPAASVTAPPPRSIPPPPMFDGRPSSKANVPPAATAAASVASKEALQKQQPAAASQSTSQQQLQQLQQQQQQQQPRPSPGAAPSPSSSAPPSASAPASGRGPPPERLAEPQRQAMEDQQWVYVHGIRYGGGVRKCGG